MSADYDRIHDPERQEHYVYRLYGKRGRLLYIGCSMNLKLRLSEHGRNGNFGHLITATSIEGPFNYFEGRRIERAAIESERPEFNREWTPRYRRGVVGWKQPDRRAIRAEGWSA